MKKSTIKILIITALTLACGYVSSYAQRPRDNAACPQAPGNPPAGTHATEPRKNAPEKWEQRVQRDRIAFISAELDLTTEEAQAFWPIYNKMAKEKRNAFKQSAEAFKAMQDAVAGNRPESEIKACIEAYTEAVERSHSKSYTQEYLKVLPASKVAKLYMAEENFRHHQIKCLGGGGKDRKPGEEQRHERQ